MIIVILILLGLCFGSFVNAFVWRLHKNKDWVKGRSECIHCHHELAPQDLLPVVSWLMLKGKCRYCHKPISAQYPCIELLTAGLFVFSYLVWPHGFDEVGVLKLVFWLVMLVGFVALLVYDLKWMLLPNKIVYSLIVLVTVQVLVVTVLRRDKDVLLGALGGLLAVGGLFWLLFQISAGKWIGGGDVKLGFALGLLAGSPLAGLLLLFLASASGSLISLPLLASGKVKRTTRIPFGPFLLLAAVLVQLFGDVILDWYQKFIFI